MSVEGDFVYRSENRHAANQLFGAKDMGTCVEDQNLEMDLNKHIQMSVLWTIIWGFGVFMIFYSDYEYAIDYTIVVGGFWSLTMYLFYCNYNHCFRSFQSIFEHGAFGISGQYFWSILFCVISFISWLLISLKYENPDKFDNKAVDIVIYITWYQAIILMIMTFYASWFYFAYSCTTSPAYHGFAIFTMFGGVILLSARYLDPRENHEQKGAWYANMFERNEILSGVVEVCFLFILMFVALGTIGMAAFAEFSKWASTLPVAVSIGLFIAISMIIMLTPLAPGSIVDACGGFVFTIVLGTKYEIKIGYILIITICVICVLHWCGACAQWYIGKIPRVQYWLNFFLPAFILACSDAVLAEASWFEVGIIGLCFMDTANGLNQGRMNMEFWTQLFSEYVCIFNAIPLVALGSSLALEGLVDIYGVIGWTQVMVPLLILMSSVFLSLGGMVGFAVLGSSTDSVEFWTSREKWCSVHHFAFSGIFITKDGYQADCFKLKTGPDCLYKKIGEVHNEYVEKRINTTQMIEQMEITEAYVDKIDEIRSAHFNKLRDQLEVMKASGHIIEGGAETVHENFWHDTNENEFKSYLQYGLVFAMIALYWANIWGFYMNMTIENSVQNGMDSIQVDIIYWFAFIAFFCCYIFYNHSELCENLNYVGGILYSFIICDCCSTDEGLSERETEFKTYPWPTKVNTDIVRNRSRGSVEN